LTPTEVNPANMSQEVLPVEMPETLYYTNPGKVMMPSNAKALQVRKQL